MLRSPSLGSYYGCQVDFRMADKFAQRGEPALSSPCQQGAGRCRNERGLIQIGPGPFSQFIDLRRIALDVTDVPDRLPSLSNGVRGPSGRDGLEPNTNRPYRLDGTGRRGPGCHDRGDPSSRSCDTDRGPYPPHWPWNLLPFRYPPESLLPKHRLLFSLVIHCFSFLLPPSLVLFITLFT